MQVSANPFSNIINDDKFFQLPTLDLSIGSLGYKYCRTDYPDGIKRESINASVTRGINGFKDYSYLIIRYQGQGSSGLHVFFRKLDKDSPYNGDCQSHDAPDSDGGLPHILRVKVKGNFEENLAELIRSGKLVDGKGNTVVTLV